MQNFNSGVSKVSNSFSGIEKKINEGFNKKDGGIGEYFDYQKKQKNSNLEGKILIIPVGFKGIEGFVFDVGKEEEISSTGELTKHVVEDKRYITSHYAEKPLVYRTGGFVGEIYEERDAINTAIDIVQGQLSTLSQYKVPFTNSANKKLNALKNVGNNNVNYVKSLYKNARNIVDFYSASNPALTRVQTTSQYFKYLKSNAVLCNIATVSYGYLTNMMIVDISIKTEYAINMSDFTLTFEQCKFAQTKFTATNLDKSQIQQLSQANSNIVKSNSGNSINKSIAKQLAEKGGLTKQLIGS
jgi:hypothetical protein